MLLLFASESSGSGDSSGGYPSLGPTLAYGASINGCRLFTWVVKPSLQNDAVYQPFEVCNLFVRKSI